MSNCSIAIPFPQPPLPGFGLPPFPPSWPPSFSVDSPFPPQPIIPGFPIPGFGLPPFPPSWPPSFSVDSPFPPLPVIPQPPLPSFGLPPFPPQLPAFAVPCPLDPD